MVSNRGWAAAEGLQAVTSIGTIIEPKPTVRICACRSPSVADGRLTVQGSTRGACHKPFFKPLADHPEGQGRSHKIGIIAITSRPVKPVSALVEASISWPLLGKDQTLKCMNYRNISCVCGIADPHRRQKTQRRDDGERHRALPERRMAKRAQAGEARVHPQSRHRRRQ